MNHSLKLGEYSASLRYEDLPAEVVEQTKKLTLQVLGASLACVHMEQAVHSMELVRAKGGFPEASVWGSSGMRAAPEDAAFANATMADTLDWEDCSWTGHPSAGAIPAAFAMGEKHKASGKRYITAVVAAYDVYQRIAMAVQPTVGSWGKVGWQLVNWQIFASSAAAAKMLDLDSDKTAACISAATYQGIRGAAGKRQTDMYHYAHGFCARNGISAALLTQQGFDFYYDSLEQYWRHVSDREQPEWFTKGLGEDYLIMETLSKHWPANMWIQAPLDVLDSLRTEHGFGPEDIEKIRVSPIIDLYLGQNLALPLPLLQAEFSLPYCFAAYMYDPEPSADWYTIENRSSTKFEELGSKVEFFGEKRTPIEQFAEFWTGSFPESSVEVILNDGTKFARTIRCPKGHPRDSFTWEEQVAMFRKQAAVVLSDARTGQLVDAVRNLDSIGNLADVGELTFAG